MARRPFVDQAHPASPIPRSDWEPPRRRQLAFPIAVAAQVLVLALVLVAVLALGAVVAAATGIPMDPPR